MTTTKHLIPFFAALTALSSACPAPLDTPDAFVAEDTGQTMDAPSRGDAPVASDAPLASDASVRPDAACASGETRCGAACVDVSTDETHCGGCDTACATGQSCVAGMCECPMGQEFCGGACIDPETSTANCGMCGNACPMGQMCVSGACRIDCPAPRVICGTGLAMACLDTATDSNHCGTCTNVCPTPANAASACTMGACGLGACNAGFADCDANAGNGCEANTTSSTTSCGGCGNVCVAFPNATTACTMGACVIGACASGFADCDGIASNGCEVNTSTSPANCGTCGRVCGAVANGSSGCSASMCTIGACNAGFADCNAATADGCEVNTTASSAHCGRCGNTCGPVPSGTTTCTASMCTIATCSVGFADCNAMPSDGCEINTTTNVLNCGACGRVCSSVANGSQACGASACGIGACNSGFSNCNGLVSDGCEVDRMSDANNCGACAAVCGAIANATRACRFGACEIGSCNARFADCDANRANGCEIHLDTDSRHCGACGRACLPGRACSAGTCL